MFICFSIAFLTNIFINFKCDENLSKLAKKLHKNK